MVYLHLNHDLTLPSFDGPFYSLKKVGGNQTLTQGTFQPSMTSGLVHSKGLINVC